ncbi:acyltransferase family protein [uncultured Gimesia sp.]|uniref:acyltransferase family protein n=1 Tax=uncultured Gimesia sp. TaxID=1678688 RepID=UPI0030DD286C|tara:strand:+ start:34201 stop:35391 length:1191 start_codon:yes stop_codon:yes gene_type:complete
MNPPRALVTPEAPALSLETLPENAGTTRFYYMDSLRSILMMLGVVLHGALIYSTGDHWIVSDSHKSEFFNVLGAIIHAFRMPTFFIIAGFFSMMGLKKYGVGTFTKVRLVRILVPLCSTALFINTLELYFRTTVIQKQPMSFTHFVIYELPQKWISGAWVSHLWFLLTLLQFFAVGIALFALCSRVSETGRLNRILTPFRKNCYFLLLLPFSDLAWSVLDKIVPELSHGSHFHGLFNTEDFIVFLPYFLVGLWLYRDKKLQQAFHSIARWEWYALALSLVAQYVESNAHGLNPESVLRIYSASLTCALSSHICYVLFYRFMNQNSQFFRYLSDASYSIYLLHHICVIVFGYLLLNVSIAIGYKFLAVEIATISITLAIHHFLILRFKPLRFLFNGK